MDPESCLQVFKYQVNPRDLEEAIKAFRYHAKRKQDQISIKKVPKLLDALHLIITENELQEILEDLDLSNQRKITCAEFLYLVATIIDQMNQDENYREAFKMYDVDGNGEINAMELKFVFANYFGVKINKQQAADLIRAVDIKGTKCLDYEAFVRLIRLSMFKNIMKNLQ